MLPVCAAESCYYHCKRVRLCISIGLLVCVSLFQSVSNIANVFLNIWNSRTWQKTVDCVSRSSRVVYRYSGPRRSGFI